MSRWLRPGAASALRRWRSPLLALALALGALSLLGGAALSGAVMPLILLGAALALATLIARDGVLRMRLGGADDAHGPGLVAVREGAVAYFGPEGGGVADLDALTAIWLAPGPDGPLWLLRAADGALLRAPAAADADGALLDAFAALPGFDAARVSRALDARVETLVWRRPGATGAARRLPRG